MKEKELTGQDLADEICGNLSSEEFARLLTDDDNKQMYYDKQYCPSCGSNDIDCTRSIAQIKEYTCWSCGRILHVLNNEIIDLEDFRNNLLEQIRFFTNKNTITKLSIENLIMLKTKLEGLYNEFKLKEEILG